MGTISSSVGLISGMNIQELVTQLMAIESRPLKQVQSRIEAVKQQQLAYTELTARLTAATSAIRRLSQPSAYGVRTATSADTNVFTVSATEGTPLGNHSFQVLSLASTHQLVSAGFTDRDRTPLNTGELTFKPAAARVDTSTLLATLNGTQGVRRGTIRITDGVGGSADIDLSMAVTIDDVISAINGQSSANVRVRVAGDRLVLTDLSGGTGGVKVQDLAGGFAAADLGLAGESATGELVGQNLVRLVEGTRLSLLNDGLGIRTDGIADDLMFTLGDGTEIKVNLSGNLQFGTKLATLNDGRGVRLPGTIRITNRSGQSGEIVLDGAETMEDVITAINSSGLSVSASLSGSKLVLSDSSGGQASHFKIEDVSGSAAADLGILADTDQNSIVSGMLYRVDTLGAVIRAIQYADGNDGRVSAAISADGKGLVIQGEAGMTVSALNGSMAAHDLGLLEGFSGPTFETRDLIAGLNTVLLSSLNGGQGVDAGVVEFTRRDGTAVQVDLSGVQTLNEVIDRINSATLSGGQPAGLVAGIDSGGMGLTITDSTGGTGTFAVRDISGTTVADLGLISAADNQVASGDLKRQYISQATRLKDLHQGDGIRYGTFRITSSDGRSGTISLAESTHRTLNDVIKSVKALDIGVEARINADGDGLELVDLAGGAGRLTVTDQNGGSAAADLGIAGQASAGSNTITGSFAGRITITAGDTLDTLVKKLNDADSGVTARVINDGNPFAPYRLVVSSTVSGKQGQIAYNAGLTGLTLGTMSVARDAVVAVTDGSTPNPIVVTSSSNTITGIVDGLTLNLTGTSTRPVTVTVEQDMESVTTDVKAFVKAFNDTMDRIDELTRFVPETNEKGVLLGDHTVQRVRDRLYSQVTRIVSGDDLPFKSLSQIGISIQSGARLAVDEERFTSAFESDPEGVRKLFTLVTENSEGKPVNQGIAVSLREALDEITRASDGLIGRQTEALQGQVDLYTRRAADMQVLLDKKEARLYAQFQAMERTLAQLQSQQSALAGLSNSIATMAPKTA